MLKVAVGVSLLCAAAAPYEPSPSVEVSPAGMTLLVVVPDDCKCLPSVVGNYSMQPTPLWCGNPVGEPCVSFQYDKLDDTASNTPGNCGLAGQQGQDPCGDRTSCNYTGYYVKAQLGSCVASCGTAPFRAFNGAGPVGKKMTGAGDKVSIPANPTDIACGGTDQKYHFEVRALGNVHQPNFVIGRYTLTASCKDCDRKGQ